MAPKVKSFHLRTGLSDELAEHLACETLLMMWRRASEFDRSQTTAIRWMYSVMRDVRIRWGTDPRFPSSASVRQDDRQTGDGPMS